MERIEFRTIEQELGIGGVFPTLVPHLSGVPLPDLVRKAELPFARGEGKPDLAGSYAGLPKDEVRWPSRHYLGDPVLSWFGDGDTVLLGCGCGDWGCWPFTAIVTVTEDTTSTTREAAPRTPATIISGTMSRRRGGWSLDPGPEVDATGRKARGDGARS